MRKLASVLTAALITAGLAAEAHAACTQNNVIGTWQAYTGGEWARCKFSIQPGGNITDGRCTNSEGQSGNMTAARLTLQNDQLCTYNGRFTLLGFVHQIKHATLSLDKNMLVGVGTLPGDVFTFTALKIGGL